MKYQIKENFLDKYQFNRIKNLITDKNFPWFKRERQVPTDKKIDLGYFTHSFFSKNSINSDYYNSHIVPILSKLNVIGPLEIRANLAPSVFFLEKTSAFHCDFKLQYPTKTAILYLNTCDGGTEMRIDNKIKFIDSRENRILIFDSDVEHRGVVSNNSDFRYIINFNYVELK